MERVGGIRTAKLPVVVKLPCGVSIVIGPVVACGGTVTVSWRSVNAALVLKAKTADTPLKSTRLALMKLLPLIVIACPG